MVYQSLYVRVSKIKELLKEGDTKIRVAGDAKEKVAEYLDEAVKAAIKELIEKLPRKSKGDSKGELRRITIQLEDFGIAKKSDDAPKSDEASTPAEIPK